MKVTKRLLKTYEKRITNYQNCSNIMYNYLAILK